MTGYPDWSVCAIFIGIVFGNGFGWAMVALYISLEVRWSSLWRFWNNFLQTDFLDRVDMEFVQWELPRVSEIRVWLHQIDSL